VYKIEQHGRTSLRRPKLSKEEVKCLMKKRIIIIILIYCNDNFSGKYWARVGPKFPDHPGIRITGVRITEGLLAYE
jgi:hypothetical protein